MALDSYNDVKAWVLRRGEEATDATSEFDADVDNALIDAWRDLYTRHPWISLQKFPPAAIVLPVAITTLTLTAAAGIGITGTLSATHPTSLTGMIFIPLGKNYIIRITSHSGGSASVVLDAVPEALTAQTGNIVQVEFDIASDFGLFLNGWWGQDKSFVPIRDEEELRREYPDPPAQGLPQMCARVGKLKVRFSSYSEIPRRLEAPYTKEPATPSGSSALEIDPHLRPIFADLGLYQLLLQKSDPTRATVILARAEAKIERAITYEDRLRLSMGRESRRTVVGPYSEGSRSGRGRGRY